MYERFIGLDVKDEYIYQDYRKFMIPILKAYGGGFSYDFRISEVLISQTKNDINRVFSIYFPDKETSESFFSDPEYLEVKKSFFEKAVESTTIISE